MACIGYARISATNEDPAAQLDALAQAGCARIFEDRVGSAVHAARPALEKAFAWLRPGDVLVVWRLDRLGRSLSHLAMTLADLETRGVGFRSLDEALDTTGPEGEATSRLIRALARFERDLAGEQTRAGLVAAVTSGRRPGRRPVMTPAKLKQAHDLIESGSSVAEAARHVKVSRTSLYKALHLEREEPGGRRRAGTRECGAIVEDKDPGAPRPTIVNAN